VWKEERVRNIAKLREQVGGNQSYMYLVSNDEASYEMKLALKPNSNHRDYTYKVLASSPDGNLRGLQGHR
jgi:hypothetical protein